MDHRLAADRSGHFFLDFLFAVAMVLMSAGAFLFGVGRLDPVKI